MSTINRIQTFTGRSQTVLRKAAKQYVERMDYTYQHKKAFLKVEKELTGKNTLAGYLHDSNKLVMFALGFPKNWVRKIHRAISPHHPKNNKVKNPMGMVIDMICSPMTKRDKQIDVRTHYESLKEFPVKGVDELLKKFGY